MCRSYRKRRGASVVEFAVVLPFLLLMVMGGIELGRAVMVQHILEEATRAGARVASLEDGSRQDVLDIVDAAMTAAKIKDYQVDMNPDPPTNLKRFEPVSVSLTVDYANVSWLTFGFMEGRSLSAVCVMPAEVEESGETKKAKKETKKAKKETTDNKKQAKKQAKKQDTKKQAKKQDTKKQAKKQT